MEDTGLSSLLEEYINEKFQENQLDTTAKRSQALKDFLQKHADKKFNKSTVNSMFHKKFNKLIKQKSISKESVGKKLKSPRIKWTKGMEAEISSESQAAPAGKVEGGKAPKLAEGQAGDTIIFEPEDVSAAINAFWLILKMNWTTLELLTDSEKASLGRLWLPAFKKYLSENWKVLVIPLLATLGMTIPKIKVARKTKKERKEKHERDTVDSTGKDRTCPFCNQIFPKAEIAEHKEQCKKKISGV